MKAARRPIVPFLPSLHSGIARRLGGALDFSSDAAMCALMNAAQMRRWREASTVEDMERYIRSCEGLDRHAYYASEPMQSPRLSPDGTSLQWRSPITTPSAPENNHAFARLYPCRNGGDAPTVIIFHALMSASDTGYQRIAAWFNAHRWAAAFPHLPYHYSRVPKGAFNGELAISADLVRNAEGLRQAVKEAQQLMDHFRARGCRRFGLIGTSYGGWVAALLASVAEDVSFLALVQPIADTEAAIWSNPVAKVLAAALRAKGVTPGIAGRHAHLTSPSHGFPKCDPAAIVLTAGSRDQIASPATLLTLQQRWNTPPMLTVPQGHFGYRAMSATLREIKRRRLLRY